MPDMKDRVMQAMRELPPLPVAVQKLLAVMNDENSSADDVTRVLSSDQALAGKVLRLVNSSYYGMSGEVATITRAVVVLGFGGVRNVAVGFGMVSALKKLGGAAMADFWEHALAAGAGAEAMAGLLGGAHDPEEAFIAGLLHDIGHVVLASAAGDAWREARERAAAGADPIDIEKELLGMSHASVGQRLMKFWQLPAVLQDSARWHHHVGTLAGGEQPLTTLVGLGDVLAGIHGGGFERPLPEEHLSRVMRTCGLEAAHVRTALAQMDTRVEAMRAFLKIADESGDLAEGTGGEVALDGEVVVLSTDPGRVAWVGGLLAHFACPVHPLKAFFNQEKGYEKVRLVILDPNSVTVPQLQKMLPFLDRTAANVAVLSSGGESRLAEQLAARYPALPYVFSRRDLAAVMQAAVPA